MYYYSRVSSIQRRSLHFLPSQRNLIISWVFWWGQTRQWSQETWVQIFSLPFTNFGKLLESAFSLQYYIFTYKTIGKLKFKNWGKLKYRASIQLLCPTLHQPLGPRPQISLSLSHTHTHITLPTYVHKIQSYLSFLFQQLPVEPRRLTCTAALPGGQ